eukprot:PDM81207.1 nuaf-1 [Pristionchus pacificus]
MIYKRSMAAAEERRAREADTGETETLLWRPNSKEADTLRVRAMASSSGRVFTLARRCYSAVASSLPTSSTPQTLYLTHVKWVTGKGQIEKYFSRYGTIRSIDMFFDPQTGLHRGFASLTFDRADSAAKALQQRPHVIDGDKVDLQLYIPLHSKTKIFTTKTDRRQKQISCRMAAPSTVCMLQSSRRLVDAARAATSVSAVQRRRTSDNAPTRQGKQNNEIISHKVKEGETEKPSLFGGFGVPMNIAFPNTKGVPGWDDREHDVKEVVKDGPAIMKRELKKLGKEIASIKGSVEKTDIIETLGGLKDDEARADFRFRTKEELALWHTGCDSDWKEGFSSVKFTPTDRGTAVFSGNISSAIMKDGRIERAGWASIKLEDKAAFNRRKYLAHWHNYSHLMIKCRGDGRSYKVMLHSPLALDMTWGDSYSYPLHTHGGPYWQYERIPFSKFFHTVAGRIQDRQQSVSLTDVSSVSIVLMDRIDGPFAFEIDWIGVVHDRSHIEETAYETYTLPLWNTHGI